MGIATWAVRRLLKQTQDLKDVAYKVTELAPAEPYFRRPVPLLDGMLDRVMGTDPFTNLDDQLSIPHGGETEHTPTLAYHIKDAEIYGSTIYKDGMRLSMAADEKGVITDFKRGLKEKPAYFESGVLTSNFATHNWFGEWLLGSTAASLIAENMGMPAIELMQERPYGHAPRYREIFELPVVQPVRAKVGELLVLEDFAQNSYRRARVAKLRERARKIPGKHQGHSVFMVRGSHGQLRLLENEPEAIEHFRAKGFHIVDPMTMTVDEVLSELRDAKWVVGVESSTFLHAALVMDQRGSIVSMVPPDRFCINGADHIQALGCGYSLMVAEPGKSGGFYANLDELEVTLELAKKTFGGESTVAEAAEPATA